MASTLENALRLVKPGEMVVSLTDILNKLGSKITEADRQELLIAMLSPRREKVQPGELISADLFNQFISDLDGLSIRVTKLETQGASTSKVRIDGFNVIQPLHVNDSIEVDGAGFLVPPVLNTVTMGGVPVTSLAMMSSETKLFFQVPSINLPVTGASVTVTVTNANGAATSPPIHVLPAVPIAAGQTQLVYTTPPVMPFGQPNITSGQPYTFIFNIRFVPAVNNTVTNAIYTITPSITGTGWSATALDTNPITVGANTTRAIHISVTAGAGSGVLSLNALETSTNTQIAPGSSIPLSITQNSPPPTPDNRVRVTLNQVAGGAAIVSGAVQFSRNQSGGVQFTVLFAEQGDYNVAAVMSSSTGWVRDSLDMSAFHVNTPPAGTTANQDINVWFTPGSQATGTDLLFTVTRPSDGLNVTYSQKVTVTG
jgi:hypothetical protein